MLKHWQYLKYVLRHKWYVFQGGLKYRAPIWNLIIHDASKFSASEWMAYANNFYGKPVADWQKAQWKLAFKTAWNHHQKRNPHHWNYWCLIKDDGKVQPLEMPVEYVLEMLADWYGAGKAINGASDECNWYVSNYHKIILHENTRKIVDIYLNILPWMVERIDNAK